MARYIDADKAKNEFNIGFGGVSHAVIANQIIDSIPTADVAPRAEVAREIFEEIERMVEVKIISIEELLFHNTASKEDVAQKKAFEEILDELAELKKKYTEGEQNDRRI